MKTVAVTQSNESLSLLLSVAHMEPVTLEKNGKPVAVVVSPEDFMMLESFERAYLQQQSLRKNSAISPVSATGESLWYSEFVD